jgi:hypothetical protein
VRLSENRIIARLAESRFFEAVKMQPSNGNLRSSSYFIARTQVQCEHCDQLSSVIGFALPPGHEVQLAGAWECVDGNAFIFHVAELAAPITQRLMQVAPLFRRKREEGHGHAYWANHCEHCGQMLSDDALHCEPGGFMPTQPDEAAAILLTRVAEAFSAEAAGYALDPEYFSLIPRR